ncbi:MAG: c-type cytochrome [Planctomycetes bacterium]|nr:c-type cytochrome [Planctomycetota bacterium]
MYTLLFASALSLCPPQADAPEGWAWELGDLRNIEPREDYHLSVEFEASIPTSILLDERWEVVIGPRGGEGEELAGTIKGVRGPLLDAALSAGEPQSIDISYWMEAGEGPHLTVWLNDRLVQDRVHLGEASGEVGLGPGEEEGRGVYLAEEGESRACDWGEDFTAITTFRTRGRGTIVSKCPPAGPWVPDAKAIFVRDGMLVYDIGWVGAVVGDVPVDDGEWHTAVITSEGGEVNMWVDGEHCGDNDDFSAKDRDEFRVKIGAANTDFAFRLEGDVASVLFYDFAIDHSEVDEPIKEEPVFRWAGTDALNEPASEEGRIRLRTQGGAARFRELSLLELGATDHAGLIMTLDEGSAARGREIYEGLCANCHGLDGKKTTNPNARPFAVGTLENGSDPYALWRTLTDGYKDMPVQDWLRPDQRYDVVHYLREEFLKDENPSQYYEVEDAWLNALPKGMTRRPPVAEGAARDYGPALASQLGGEVGAALTIRLDEDATISYDLQMAESSGAWTGGFLDLSNTQHHKQRGEGRATPSGEMIPGLEGWAWGHDGSLDFDRGERWPRGPLPRKWLHHRGHYLYGDDLVLSYEIDGRGVLEHPSVDRSAGFPVITHRLHVEPGETELILSLAETPGSGASLSEASGFDGEAAGAFSWSLAVAGWGGEGEDPGPFTACAAIGGGALEVDGAGRVVLKIPAAESPQEYWLLRAGGRDKGTLDGLRLLLTNFAERERPISPASMTSGGELRWGEVLTTKGRLGEEAPYALDTIEVPFENPWGAWVRTSAVDFFEDGRAAVSTLGGDIWIVSGLDAGLEEVQWKRYAAGMFEPLGLAVVDGEVIVTCRDRLTRLHDLNDDGEADFYESFYADTDVSTTFHAFNFDLQEDANGDLFFVKSGQYTDSDLGGAVMRVTPAGEAFVHSTGFRTPNGMGMSPDGRPLVSDNQGNWIPASKVSLTKRGGFYGVFPAINNGGAGEQTREDFDQPAIWMPQRFDSSCGGQLWVDDERFGPLSGRYLHTSFGKGWMYGLEIVDGAVPQGAVWRLPLQFDAGIQRLRLGPHDGAVYAVGLSGWQGPSGGKDGCLERVRWTGADEVVLKGAQVVHDGVVLEFSGPIKAAEAGDFTAKRWNYRWSRGYGSAHYSLIEPNRKGEDSLEVLSATAEGVRVHVVFEDMRVAHQLALSYDLGDGLTGEVLFTVNEVPEPEAGR